MDKTQAVALIENLFDRTFSEEKFVLFCTNLFNDFNTAKATPVQSGTYVYEPYRNHIKSFKRVGQYTDPNGEILDVLAVKVNEGYKLERTRTGLRNFAIEYLKRKNDRDTLLIAFHSDDCPDWRLSFVKLEYKTSKDGKGKIKARQEATSARRYSFLVGEYEPCHTAKRQLLPLLLQNDTNPTLADLEHCFNIEKVTKEFFEQYKTLFVDLQEQLDAVIKKDKKIAADFEAKNIDSSAFAKKLLGQIVFLYFIQKKGWLGVPKDKSFGYGDKRFLKSLLAQAEDAKANYYNYYLEFLFYEALAAQRTSTDPSYYKKFNCRIPFLNGGLFEPIKDYDWQNTEINLPNEIFHNTKPTKENDVGTGILDVFDRYNFTVKEDEPLDKEVAVDPEMLGKVFENLLEVKDRKSKGAFYTPREIVHYMCQESLINYLDTTLNSSTASYQKLGENQTDLLGNTARKQTTLEFENKETKIPKTDIDAFIKNSHLVVEDNRKNDNSYTWKLPEAIKRHAKLFDAALAEIKVCDPAIGSGAFPVGMLSEIVKARTALTPYMKLKDDDESRTQYHLKRECIQNSLYGVDIDESAIDIAKLRLWLSLVVDEESIQDIEPLPNLDYKIVCGNSLLGLPDGVMHDDGLEKEIEELKKEYFGQTDNRQKRKLKNAIGEKFKEIIKSMRVFSKDVPDISFDFKIHFSEVWHGKGGFDVVIGNPPYARKIDDKTKKMINKLFETASYQVDLYVAFFEKSINISNITGTVSLITPNSWIKNLKMQLLRKFILDHTEVKSITPMISDAFSEANVETSIVLLSCKQSGNRHCEIRNYSDGEFVTSHIVEPSQYRNNEGMVFTVGANLEVLGILTKIKLAKETIDSLFNVSRGINPYDALRGQSKDVIKNRVYHSDIKKDKTFVPELKGKHVEPFHYNWDQKHFISYGPWLAAPREERFFQGERIILREILGERLFCTVIEEDFKIDRSLYIALPKSQSGANIHYVLGVLISKLYTFYFKYNNNEFDLLFPKIRVEEFRKLPIKIIPLTEQKVISSCVKKIISNKKLDSKTNTLLLEAQLEARVAHLYSLTESEYQLILEGTEDTFRITALNYFRDIQKGIIK